jgi:hypothetical protein
MAIQQCGKKDVVWLSSMMMDDDIFDGCSEDGSEKKGLLKHIASMVSRDDVVVLSLIPGKMIQTFVRRNGVMWDIHIAISKKCTLSGKERLELSHDACAWMVHHRGARKFAAQIPKTNRAAQRYAAACGLQRAGMLTSAIRKNGIMVDMVIYQSCEDDMKKLLQRGD